MNKILASVLCILIKNALFIYRNPLQLKRPLVLFVAFTSCTNGLQGGKGGGGGEGRDYVWDREVMFTQLVNWSPCRVSAPDNCGIFFVNKYLILKKRRLWLLIPIRGPRRLTI